MAYALGTGETLAKYYALLFTYNERDARKEPDPRSKEPRP
jgi:hypothetical protein